LSRIPRHTARRIDRLSRAAHRFHRFAHHPLCERYAGEVVRIGTRTRLCRGCTYAAIGGAIGFGVGLVATNAIALVAAITATLTIVSTLYTRRRTKLITRLVPAALFTIAIVAGAITTRSPLGLAAALAAATSVGALRVLYGKRGADRTPCATCPERVLQPCSGFQPIVSRERAFQRVAAQLIARR